MSETVAPSGSSPEDQALLLFARATLDLLQIWPALRLAITHGWGGGTKQSIQGRTHLAEDIVDLFYSTATTSNSTASSSSSSQNQGGSTSLSEGGIALPARDDVEETLKWSISQQFDLDLEDGSEATIAKDLIALWRECIRRVLTNDPNEGPLATKFRTGADKAKREDGEQRFAAQRAPGQDGEDNDDDTTDEDDDSDGFETEEDEHMGDVQHEAPPPRERPEPVIDEDGFEMVQPKKKGGRR
ncbi:Tsr2p [Sporobolomyces koalae]|uniref:Tsr2p n=1 Tax=Sporobolomyces koalae TaxID=500713 RepID=UPI00317AF7B3